MPTIYPPSSLEIPSTHKSIFLAGSIDMGNAIDWQQEIIDNFEENPMLHFFNPRRKDWDSSWEQTIENTYFKEQVTWELDALEKADLIVFYFAPTSKAPISLLELGLFARKENIVVCCPKGYWRKGNVDIVCERFGIKQIETLKHLIEEIEKITH
ncbi:nucleoside 2-deoxyribosyltransferase domain-containing protein [Bernardetia sp.]|uniref:nucleoside 2-deoxyribosyltransferase domain-containing protein n=1 Tax=Bernardetia sp. TaxID=1937974 RepID=UPI0025BF5F42|nr:nucleoside 2-deoxyribosyltransferase domain-containing protein [Bernardetia sp.]